MLLALSPPPKKTLQNPHPKKKQIPPRKAKSRTLRALNRRISYTVDWDAMDPWRFRRVTVTVKMGGFLQEKPTYPTWEKENHRLKSAFKKGIILVPRRVVLQPLDRFFFSFFQPQKNAGFFLYMHQVLPSKLARYSWCEFFFDILE